MDKLIKTLPAILKAAADSAEVAEAACTAAWKHVVGEGLSSHAIPIQLQDQTLAFVPKLVAVVLTLDRKSVV